jgi:hypothetical protein
MIDDRLVEAAQLGVRYDLLSGKERQELEALRRMRKAILGLADWSSSSLIFGFGYNRCREDVRQIVFDHSPVEGA